MTTEATLPQVTEILPEMGTRVTTENGRDLLVDLMGAATLTLVKEGGFKLELVKGAELEKGSLPPQWETLPEKVREYLAMLDFAGFRLAAGKGMRDGGESCWITTDGNDVFDKVLGEEITFPRLVLTFDQQGEPSTWAILKENA